MSTKSKVFLFIAALLTAFAFGRYSVPKTVKIDTKTTEVDNKTVDADRDKHKETTVTEVVKPDGTKETTTKTVEDSHVTKNVTNNDVKNSDTKTETVYGGSATSLSAMAGIDFSGKNIVYGGHVTKQLIGPINAGAWGLTNGVVGVSLGLSF